MYPELRSWKQLLSPHLTVTAAAVQISQTKPEGKASKELTEANPNVTKLNSCQTSSVQQYPLNQYHKCADKALSMEKAVK